MWNEPSAEQLAVLPGLYSTEDYGSLDKVVHMHFFLGSFDFYAVEYDGEDCLFGFTCFGDLGNAEWGYSSLQELKNVSVKGFEIDRDLDWTPVRSGEIDLIKRWAKTRGIKADFTVRWRLEAWNKVAEELMTVSCPFIEGESLTLSPTLQSYLANLPSVRRAVQVNAVPTEIILDAVVPIEPMEDFETLKLSAPFGIKVIAKKENGELLFSECLFDASFIRSVALENGKSFLSIKDLVEKFGSTPARNRMRVLVGKLVKCQRNLES